MRQFIDAICALPPRDPDDRLMMETVRANRVCPDELERHVSWEPDRYTRHLVYLDERFQVMVLCWQVGALTPVHDHAGQRCWMTLERGRIEVADFLWKEDGGAPKLMSAEVVGGESGDVHIDRCASVHRIANLAEWGERAISLHVYSRPFSCCGVYCCQTGKRDDLTLSFDSIGPLVSQDMRRRINC